MLIYELKVNWGLNIAVVLFLVLWGVIVIGFPYWKRYLPPSPKDILSKYMWFEHLWSDDAKWYIERVIKAILRIWGCMALVAAILFCGYTLKQAVRIHKLYQNSEVQYVTGTVQKHEGSVDDGETFSIKGKRLHLESMGNMLHDGQRLTVGYVFDKASRRRVVVSVWQNEDVDQRSPEE